ncbi:MAG: nicotinate (nicotinamide) nucleotide adenylyltransferase [Verrucomicrobia bacterium]|nr:nicotinate (nicotinamide) nucleotide adenylyltransferase [Verrucomicrobiota bacterium]
MKKKIGFFGGSFDPIHFGHIYLALQLAEAHHLDSVWVCPAFTSPFKSSQNPHHRLKMVQLAVEEIPHFKVLSTEIDRGGTSYTIDTIRSLSSENQYHLLLSEETALELPQWKEYEELIRLAPPLIGQRGLASTQKGLTPTKRMDISSTEIRSRLKKNLYCGHLVPAKALDYIHSHRLYSSG